MRKLFTILSVCALFGYGCTQSLEPQRRPVALSASVGEVLVDGSLQTKDGASAAPYTGTPSAVNQLDVALWLSYSPGSYSHDPQQPQYLPCATTASYTGSTPVDIRYNDNIILYPISADHNYSTVGDKVYCVGFYPASDWGDPSSTTPVTSASHAITGSEDLMFADQMVGSYASNFAKQTFNHLLTWVKINMNATSLKAAEVWGEVESLEIVSPKNNVSISFSNELQDGSPKSSTVTYTGSAQEFTLALPDDKSLMLTTRTFGQVFCSPPAPAALNADTNIYEYSEPSGDSSEELGYIVRVRTKNLPEKEAFVTLKKEDNVTDIGNADYAVGKLFVVTLHLNEAAVVEGVCTLRQWDDQVSDIYMN